MPLFFLGTREWRNRQTRTVQVRVPVMEWGFNSPLAHDETADPTGSAVFVFPGCGCGVACLPAGVPGAGCVGPGCFVRPWAAARPPARLGSLTSFGAAPRSPPVPSGPSGALHTRGAGLRRGRRPAREPSALRAFGSARRLESRPSPATAHGHRSRSLRRPPHRRRCVAGVWLGASARSPARPRASKRSLSSVSHAIP